MTSVGGEVRNFLGSKNAWSASSVQAKTSFFNNLKNDITHSPNHEINQHRDVMEPAKRWTCLMSDGLIMFRIIEIFYRLASMPRQLMMNPSDYPIGTTNTHFFGLSL
ncbi:hypothetical protein GUJ93_ZPchr0012g19213 [Zizania palustris]|uniref:Uncharacterized protein n=1 Tax=Zizania palustris TaxID=103762 RepID=A0A8J6BTZ6_ZIZPA|nr:hypothetical protein GUJ93_ZPchr0012g19213 [Zizania palustris]